ncbi:MAG: multidrug efflux system outer membrane protein [Brevundimonas sp.]|jgi:multidrug efflux system outer membrane protein|uniref:efflux transporter outer membrane subunit n=1 Tax=Brevundimonas sp. TaxID=1871086 RepID=UPI0039E612BD
MIRKPLISRLAALAAAGAAAACAGLPAYRTPELPAEPFLRAGEGEERGWPPAHPFWEAYGDRTLSGLIETALENNRDVATAMARLDQARALLQASRAELRPQISTRAALQQATGSVLAEDASAPWRVDLEAAWEADLFGRIRRQIDASNAGWQASAADVEAVRVALAGDLTHAYFELRGRQEQLRIARETARSQGETLEMFRRRADAGAAAGLDVDRALGQLETTRALTPALEGEVAALIHRVAVLAGLLPSQAGSLLEEPGPLPVNFPAPRLDTPAEVLLRRPDVAAAERRLAAAWARSGSARASYFPQISLGSLIGWSEGGGSLRQGALAAAWVLDFGRTGAAVSHADAEAREALAVWEQAVLLAVEDIETALVLAGGAAAETDHRTRAAEAAGRAVLAARARYRAGEADGLDVLDAERTLLSAQSEAVLSRMRHGQAHAALHQALAGGWPLTASQSDAGMGSGLDGWPCRDHDGSGPGSAIGRGDCDP